MVMKYTMDKSIKECVPKTERAKDFLEYVKANYTKIDKAEMTTYLKLLTTTMYDGVGGVKDHIIKLKHYFNKLTYNALKEEWTLEELMSIVVQHEVSLKKNEIHSFALVTDQVSNMKKKPSHKNFGGSKQFKRKGNSSQGTSNASASSNATKSERFKGKCNFCHKIGHKQCARMNLSSSMLWPKHLGHISRQRLDRLVRDGVLSNLDFSDFETCVVCSKRKMTTKTKYEKIDRYGYVELIHEKSYFLNVFKAFKAKVELQLGKPIKVVKSDRSGTPRKNGVAEMRNRTLLDMVSKSVPKTPYELWSEKKLSFRYFHVWGCKAEVRPYNPQSKKLDPKTINGFFVGYCIGSRGCRFYCPSHTTRNIESNRDVYFEDEVNVDPNFVPYEIFFGEEHVIIPFHTSHVPNVDVPILQQSATNEGKHGDQVELGIPVDDTVVDGITLRRSQKIRRPAISDDYMVYLQEHEYDGSNASDPITFQDAIHCPQFPS
ncbi:Retrovirus-related Pol polyprotein from transposon TNT 1-94 [Vitis vinifera]|uniref:Retrovirus-related Pol polyprotein from transposon TNT 1-94 n=1 Tax=Vitis vinifera TaxID=29760 RepID=A0A438JXE8_VITVI|nr:Retrovirus-related Pol polyprotein from transposon TNT 1-94 [Vitis vinifera]